MILKIYLYLCLSHVLMVVYGKTKCIPGNNGYCEFRNVHTTESDQYFKPTADNPEEVTEVEFENSTLKVFTNELCEEFPNLNLLRADKLDINTIKENALENCKKITLADFADNKIKEIPDELFKNNLELEAVSFSNNLIRTFNPKIFLDTKNITYINFGDNYIADFPINEFPKLNDLRTFHIGNNEIVDIDEKEILNKFPKLKSILLHDNPFDCGRIKVIIDEFTERNVTMDYWSITQRVRKHNLTKKGNVHCLVRDTDTEWLSKKVNELSLNMKKTLDKFSSIIAEIESIKEIAETKNTEQITEIEKIEEMIHNDKTRSPMVMITILLIFVILFSSALKKAYNIISLKAK